MVSFLLVFLLVCSVLLFLQVRRSPGSNRYASKFTVKTVKHAASVMAWGEFSAAGLGGLHFLPKGVTMNSDRYIEVS